MEELINPEQPTPEGLFESAEDNSASALFQGMQQEIFEQPAEATPNPSTTQLVALATADEGQLNVGSFDDEVGTAKYLQQQVEAARARLTANEETRIRREIAADRSLKEQLRSSSALKQSFPTMDPNVAKQIFADTAIRVRENMDGKVRVALEEQALEKVQNLAASDPTQAKLILNRLTPGKMDANDVWNDYLVTQAALMQRFDRAKKDESEEGWGAAIYTGILNMLQPSSFSYLGNVDEGVGGYNPSFFRFFFPGSERGIQNRAFWSLPAAERLAYIDKMDANIMDNSTTWWVSDPDKRVELYSDLLNPGDEVVEGRNDAWNAAELGSYVAPYIGVVPYRALSRAASLPGVLVSAGARKEAAASVANAYDSVVKSGRDTVKDATGLSPDDVVDNMMPTSINPHGLGDMPDTYIGLSGEVNDGIDLARETIKAFSLTNTERLTTNEEIVAAFAKTAEDVKARFKNATILDTNNITTSLADGTVVRSVEATIGKPGGGLWGSEAEMRGYASQMGYGDIGVERIGPETRIVTPEEEGFTIIGYHGGKGGIIEFDESMRGMSTGAASADKATFMASPKGAYKGWTKLEWEQYADELEAEMPVLNEILSKNNGILGMLNRPTREEFEILYKAAFKYGESWFQKSYPDFKTWWKVNKRPLVGEAKGKWAVEVNSGQIFDSLERELRLAREVDPQNAVNIAWSYARMSGDTPLNMSDANLLDNISGKPSPENDPYFGGSTIYPVKIKGDNLKVVEGDRSIYDDVVYSDELDIASKEGYGGVVFRNASDPGNIDNNLPYPDAGSYDVIALFKNENLRMALAPGKVVQDSSGGYAMKVKMDVADTAFLTNPASPPPQGFLAKFWKNTSQTSDKSIFAKAVVADSKFARFQQIIDKNLNKSFRDLKSKERMWVNQILAKGQTEQKWFTEDQFKLLYAKATGEPASERAVTAYNQYKLNNDIEFVLRNDGVYREKLIRKYESFKFNAQGDEFDLDGVLLTGSKVPQGRAFNASDNVHYAADDGLSKARMQELLDNDYVMIRLEKNIQLKDGVEANHVMMKKSDLDIQPLRRNQLGYVAGGHRLYSDKIFIKQAIKGIHPDTAQAFWKEPKTWATAPNIKEARDYAKIMNAARDAVLKGKDAQYLDEVVFGGKGGAIDTNLPYPSGDEFVKAMDEGRISKTESFEAVYDRELPSAYREGRVDASKFMDEEDMTGLAGYYRQIGQMYYSPKGEHLRSVRGGLAPVVDPFEAQNRALINVSRMSGSFSDFKTNAIERWVKSYEPYLDTSGLSDETARSAYATFASAPVRRDVPPALLQQITGQREAIKRILGFKSEFERGYQQWLRSMSEWVIGDSDNGIRRGLSQSFLWMEDKNPVGFLRGLAFDMKLGMFNVGQFFIQTSTMASALALNPKHGKFGLASAMPVWSYFLSNGSENVLETLTKRGVHKLAGFDDPEMFKKYIREARNSGFFSLGDTHAMVNDNGIMSTFGGIKGGAESFREKGRFFFYQAEVLNRLVAHRIAFGEAVEKFGVNAMDNFEFKEFAAARAENYSFNMSGVSKAWWQHGVLSVPTQFWAYQVRMIEAMTGKNFTAPQKLRLIGMQMLMAGTAGVPVLAGIADYAKQQTGEEPDIDSMLGTLDRGLGDRLIYEMFGADVLVSEKWGTGSWSSDLVKDLFGLSEYNEKSFAEISLGATGSILFTTLGPVFELAKFYMTHESGSEEIGMTSEQWLKLAGNISSIGNALKAQMVYNYGIYKSGRGKVLADSIPSEDAMFIAMGFRPHEVDAASVMQAYNTNRADSVKEAADVIVGWRQEAFANPSDMAETAQRVNAFVKMLPPDIKRDVLRQAQRKNDPSFYRSVVERYEKNKHKEQIAKQIEGMEE